MLLSGSTVRANLLLGPANISDLLDSEFGADNGGHQPDTQPAMEKETGEQQYPESPFSEIKLICFICYDTF